MKKMDYSSLAGGKGRVALGNRQFLKKINKQTNKLITQLSHHPAVVLLNIYPRKIETSLHTKTYIQMFIAALFVLPKPGNNLT